MTFSGCSTIPVTKTIYVGLPDSLKVRCDNYTREPINVTRDIILSLLEAERQLEVCASRVDAIISYDDKILEELSNGNSRRDGSK